MSCTGGAGPRIEAPSTGTVIMNTPIASACHIACAECACILFTCQRAFVESGGFEPPTTRVQGGRSSS